MQLPFATVVALGVAVTASVCDLITRRIPNILTLGAGAAGVCCGLAVQGLDGLGWSLAGWAVGLAVFLPLFFVHGMGAGDVKLLAALGSWVGPDVVLWTALYGAVAGAILATCVALARGYLRPAMRNIGRILAHWRVFGFTPVPELTLADATAPRLPYAVPIAVGLVIALSSSW